MVKNTTGGCKAKGKARKLNGGASRPNTHVRISMCDEEEYAQVTRVLGNGMCHVFCADGATRLCHIRGKFRWRGKSDNNAKVGAWLLVGLRAWESGASKKLQNCDLLEVYSDAEKEKLKTSVNIDWSVFTTNDNKNANLSHDTVDSFVFTDQKEDEYHELLKASVEASVVSTNTASVVQAADDDEINVDDI